MNYFAAELHCHTLHSDGDFTPRGLQNAAVEDGLSIIALTDHNTFSGAAELDEEIIPVIKGIEWTTYFGHMLVLGAGSFVDWRDAVPDNIDDKIKKVKQAGGTVGIAHPFQCGSPICTGGRWEFNVNDWENVNYIEIWHESFYAGNTENDRACAMWTALLDKGYHLAASYGKDWHRPCLGSGIFGCTYLGIENDISEASALDAIRHGRMVVSVGVKFSFSMNQNEKIYEIGDTVPSGKATFNFSTDLKARGRSEIEYSSIRIVTNCTEVIIEIPVNQKNVDVILERNHWYRAELWGSINGTPQALSITSPIYVEK